jgi:hypothetical protein
VVTVVSEWVLLGPFWYAVRSRLPPISLPDLVWQPALSAGAMGLVVLWVRDLNPWLAIPLGGAVYLLALFATGGLTLADLRALRRVDQES